jgi:hypothetical protein
MCPKGHSSRDTRHRQMGNIFLVYIICHDDIQHVIRYTQDTQRKAGISCDRTFMGYTHDEYFDKLLNARYL